MFLVRIVCTLSVIVATVGLTPARAQIGPDTAILIKAQREAMTAFAFIDGVWRGTATTVLPSGDKRVITQTERIGPFLGGSVRVIEGRGYDASGNVSFNALGIISFDPTRRAFNLRSYALGHAGDFAIERTADGYTWELPVGPATIRYTAVVKDGVLTEFGDRMVQGKDPVRFFEMKLRRLGDTDWPVAGAINPE
jgi:hypothetical protein